MSQTNRISIVDTLRGWALLIVTISNITGYAYSDKGTIHGEGVFSDIIEAIEKYLFVAKGWSLLFVLFGFGFGTLMDKAKGNKYSYFAKRMLVLFGFAIVNSLLYNGDILRDYAALGLLGLLFYKLSSKNLLIMSTVLLLFFPFLCAYIFSLDSSYIFAEAEKIAPLKHSHNWFDIFKYNLLTSYYYEVISPFYLYLVHYQMFVCMLFGLALQKINFFQNIEKHYKKLKLTAISTLLFSILLTVILTYSRKNKADYLESFNPYFWTVTSTMIFTASSICLLHIKGKIKWLLSRFSIYGKMTFTNYMMQSVISFFVFQGVGLRLYDTMPFYFYFVFAMTVFMLQVAFSNWWLKIYNYGPVEWLWRWLSGTKSKPLVIE